jgi:hypothetical protein
MVLARRSFPSRIADLAFSITVPEEFGPLPLPEEKIDFTDPVKMVPLAILSSPVAAALISITARPAYEDGTVMDWVLYLMKHYRFTPTSMSHGAVGGHHHAHPAILSEGHETQEDMLLRFHMAAFEDGGRFVVAHGICPDAIWSSFGEILHDAVRTVELDSPMNPRFAMLQGQGIPTLLPPKGA